MEIDTKLILIVIIILFLGYIYKRNIRNSNPDNTTSTFPATPESTTSPMVEIQTPGDYLITNLLNRDKPYFSMIRTNVNIYNFTQEQILEFIRKYNGLNNDTNFKNPYFYAIINLSSPDKYYDESENVYAYIILYSYIFPFNKENIPEIKGKEITDSTNSVWKRTIIRNPITGIKYTSTIGSASIYTGPFNILNTPTSTPLITQDSQLTEYLQKGIFNGPLQIINNDGLLDKKSFNFLGVKLSSTANNVCYLYKAMKINKYIGTLMFIKHLLFTQNRVVFIFYESPDVIKVSKYLNWIINTCKKEDMPGKIMINCLQVEIPHGRNMDSNSLSIITLDQLKNYLNLVDYNDISRYESLCYNM